MNLELKSSIKSYLNKEEYLEKALQQIQRDFEMSGLSFEGSFDTDVNYQSLLNIVYSNISSLFQGSGSTLKNLLYRIDISEKAIQKKMSDKSEDQIEEVICHLLIERCMLKVLIKEKYSQS